MNDKRLLARAVVRARASLEEALKDTRRWPLAELHQLFEAVAAYTDATAGDEMIHRCVAGCVSGLHEYLADQGRHVPPDTVHEARCLEVLLFDNFDLPADDHVEHEHELDAHGDYEDEAEDAEAEDAEAEDAEAEDAEAEDAEAEDAEAEDAEAEDAEAEDADEEDRELDHDTTADDGQVRRDDDESR